jgi:hypothetical protein
MESAKGLGVVSGASMTMALLQSLCTAILTINGVRVAIGVGALAAGSIAAPLLSFHRDAIRTPMLVLAVAGALINLAVLYWIRHLRSRPASQWRRREPSAKERRSERLQVALSILTLVLVALELWTHSVLEHKPPAPAPMAITQSGS